MTTTVPASGSGGSHRSTNTPFTPSPAYSQAQGSSQRPLSREPEDGPKYGEPMAKDTVQGAENDGDGRRVSTTCELLCNYVIGKAKPLVFGQLLAFWLVRHCLEQKQLNVKTPLLCMMHFIFFFLSPPFRERIDRLPREPYNQS